MIKLVIEGEKLTLHASNSKECLDVLQFLYSEDCKQKVDMSFLKGTEKVDGSMQYTPYKDISTTAPMPKAKPVIDGRTTINNNTYGTTVRKKLVFFKCEECGSIACSMMDLSVDEPTCECHHCGHIIDIDPEQLHVGKYTCSDCGNTGNFLMQETVSEVRCKSCKRMQTLAWSDGDEAYMNID